MAMVDIGLFFLWSLVAIVIKDSMKTTQNAKCLGESHCMWSNPTAERKEMTDEETRLRPKN